ncbi:MAG TPA: MarR family transcriptional regulator [Gaiellaceae bacterium]
MSSQILTTQSSTAVEVFIRLLRGHAATTRALSSELQEEHGLTINDYEALLRISRADEGTMRRVDLAKALVLTPSGVTRLLDGLERCGLVEKASCSSDARVSYAVLTPAGKKRLKEASRSHLASVRALFTERYTDEELETLGELLARLPDAGRADESECVPE